MGNVVLNLLKINVLKITVNEITKNLVYLIIIHNYKLFNKQI